MDAASMSFYLTADVADAAFRADPLRALDEQRRLLHSQIDKLRELVLAQASVTTLNPLANEMAAGALSIDIGKKPRDLLNPKAAKYMLDVFSLKDTLGKKETREISAACNLTVTQVRDFFASQRATVRKAIRAALLKYSKSKAPKLLTDTPIEVSNTRKEVANTPKTDTPNEGTDIPKESADTPNGVTDNVASLDQPVPLSILPPISFPEYGASQGCADGPGTSEFFNGASSGPKTVDLANGVKISETAPNSLHNCYVNIETKYCTSSQHASMMDPYTVKAGFMSHTVISQHNGRPPNERPSGALPLQQNSADVKAQEALSKEIKPPGSVDSLDKKFLDSVFALMRKAVTFTGQEEILESILEIKNYTILNWFLTMGGLKILAMWLTEAADDEQTSYLRIVFKVLYHLPLRRASPADLSAVIETLNKLRFYRASDIQEKAKVLLTRLSKQLFQSVRKSQQNLKGKNIPTDKSLGVLDETWSSELGIPEDILALTDSAEDYREIGPSKVPRLLSGPDDASRKSIAPQKPSIRRKVQLVEHPDQKILGKGPRVARTTSSNHSRPLSADDIHKAKKQAIFMQDKYGDGKSDASKSEEKAVLAGNPPKPPAIEHLIPLPPSEEPVPLEGLDVQNSAVTSSAVPLNEETNASLESTSIPQETMLERLQRVRVPWRMPPVVKADPPVFIADGGESKELRVQVQRIAREQEAVYSRREDVPLNPKDPWDREMDFDDSLTPLISLDEKEEAASAAAAPVEEVPQASTSAAMPDFELLAVLLQNPDVVYALTSSEAQSMPAERQAALMDTLKKSGFRLEDLQAAMAIASQQVAGMQAEAAHQPSPAQLQVQVPVPAQPDAVPASLPSPTPPSDPAARANWRSDFPTPVRVPVLQQHLPANRVVDVVPSATAPSYASAMHQHSVLSASINPSAQQLLSLDGRILMQHIPTPAVSQYQTVDRSAMFSSQSQPQYQQREASQFEQAFLKQSMAVAAAVAQHSSLGYTAGASPWAATPTAAVERTLADHQVSSSYTPYAAAAAAATSIPQPMRYSLSSQQKAAAAHYSLSAQNSLSSQLQQQTTTSRYSLASQPMFSSSHSEAPAVATATLATRLSEFRSGWDVTPPLGDAAHGRPAHGLSSGRGHEWERDQSRRGGGGGERKSRWR